MTQPAFGVICDICRKPGDDHYAVGEMTVCGGCWDPFGEFDHVSERRSRDAIVRAESGML